MPVPIRDGYEFDGWYTNENLEGSQVTSISLGEEDNKTYYAKWAINSYTLELTRSNALAGSVTGSGIKEYNSEVTITATTNPGYTFIGWYNGEDLVSSLATYTFNMPASDLSYEAKWEANQNTLSFDSNGGAGEMSSVLVETNETINLPKNTFTRIGYTFVGWSTSEIGEVEYLDEANYTMGTLASYTLYAKWAKPSTEGLMFELKEDNTYEVIGYQGISTEIIIEHTYREKTITSIGDKAFSYCSSLSTITIPSSVTSIGTSAFAGCSGLTSIVIPSSVTTIGTSAFSGCSRLTSIIIPEGVTSIGDKAFYGCSSLTSIIIPEGVTSIGAYAFYGCSGLTSITIPSSVTSIGYYAFYGCSRLTSITIPSSVTSIGYGAFSGCSSLTSISLPFVGASRTATGTSALFGYIFGTTSYTGGSSTKQYYTSSSYSIYYIPASLKTVIITDATTLGYGVFYGCSSLTSIIIQEGVTSIGDNAFYGCSSLTNITIPTSVTSIGYGAFYGCISLTSIVIPTSVTSIGDWAFMDCISLTSISLPFVGASRTATGTSALFGYIFGTTSYIPTSLKTVIITDATTIGYGAFSGCSGLTSIIIQEGVTSIGDYAFSGCSSLTSITIPNSVTSIGCEAFGGCSRLTSITIPNSVTSIDNYAFSGCSSLTSITIPSSVTSIGNGTFDGCSSLTSITIPSSVTSIGERAFSGCSSLTSISLPFVGASRTATGTSALFGYIFGDTPYTGGNSTNQYYASSIYSCSTYYIPTSLKTVIITDATKIGYGAFYSCSRLTSIIIPEGVTSIGDKAFYGCSSLTIYAEASSKPAGWHSNWNPSNRPVVWGYTGE